MRTARLTALAAAVTATAVAGVVLTAGPGQSVVGGTAPRLAAVASAACAYPATLPVLTLSSPATALKGTTIVLQGTFSKSTCAIPGATVTVYVTDSTGSAVATALPTTVKTGTDGSFRLDYKLANASGRTYTFHAMAKDPDFQTASTSLPTKTVAA